MSGRIVGSDLPNMSGLATVQLRCTHGVPAGRGHNADGGLGNSTR